MYKYQIVVPRMKKM